MKIRNLSIITIALLLSSLVGCASITQGTQQKILIQTTPVSGASCCIRNNMGSWYLPCTPGVVAVHRSAHDMTITVTKPGYITQTITVGSRTKAMVFGNVIFGGVVGAGVDCADGAAFWYPKSIVIPMTPLHRN